LVGVAAGEFQYQFVDPLEPLPQSVLDQLTAQGESDDDRHTGCALGTSLNLWDICIGQMTVSSKRADYAKFLPSVRFALMPVDFHIWPTFPSLPCRQLGQSVEYLIVKQDVKEPTFREHMASVFLPFTNELWAVCIVFLVVFGIAFALLERGGGDFEDDSSPFVSSMYMSFFSGVSGGPAYAPITPGGRIIMLGFAWLLLISLASYTANLASILVVANSVQGITGMADGDTPFITKDGAKLCVPHESVVPCRSAARTPA
jgi:hypothetical protein